MARGKGKGGCGPHGSLKHLSYFLGCLFLILVIVAGVVLYQNLYADGAALGEQRVTNDQCLKAGGVISNDKCFLIPSVAVAHENVNAAHPGYTWTKAGEACFSEYQGRLATPVDKLENDDLWGLVSRTATAAEVSWSYYWTGYNDLSVEGEYRDTEGVAQQFINYVTGEPLRLNDNDCIGIARTDSSGIRAETGKMQELGCSSQYLFACQAYLAAVPSQPRAVSAVARPEGGAVTVAFTSPETDGGKPITNCTARAFRSDIDNGLSHTNEMTANGGVNTIVISGLVVGANYTFDAFCTNIVGNGFPSERTAAVVVPSVAPDAPANVLAMAGKGSAYLTFTEGASNGGSPVTHYYVTAPGFTSREFTAAEASPYIIVTGLTDGTAYTFSVQAGNDAYTRNSKDVQYLSTAGVSNSPVTPAAANPAAITGTPVAQDGLARSSKVTFTQSADGTVTGYIITCHPTCPPQGSQAYDANGITVSNLMANVDYIFFVQAVNPNGASVPSSPSNSVTPTPSEPGKISPAPTATKYGRGANVTWTVPSDNGGAEITTYTITVSKNGALDSTEVVAGDTTSYVIRGLDLGESYTFVVYGTNSQGNGDFSDVSNAVVPDSREPDAPAGAITLTTRATADGGRGFTVAFTVPASPSDCGAAADCAIISVFITATDSAGVVTTYSKSTTGSAEFSELIEDASLVVGENVTVTVQIVNPVGMSIESGVSNPVTIEAGAPSEVQALTLTGGNGLMVTIAYDAPSDNGGVPFTGVYAELVVTGGGGRSTVHAGSLVNGNTFGFAGLGDFCPGGTPTTCDPIQIKVMAENAAGQRSAGTIQSVTCSPTAPDIPPVPIVVGRTAGFSINFVDPIFDGAAALTTWEYEYKEVNATNWTSADAPVTHSSTKSVNIDADRDRVFHARVRCTNAINTTEWSAESGNVTAGYEPASDELDTVLLAQMIGAIVAFCMLACLLLYCKAKDIWCFAWTDKC